jgi:pilus assembly protein CpaF
MLTLPAQARIRDRYRTRAEPIDDAVSLLRRLVAEEAPLLADADIAAAVGRLHAEVAGYGPLEPLCRDADVSDVLVNGPGEVWVERSGTLMPSGVMITADEISVIIERVLGPLGLRADRANPIVDGRLPDGSRISVVLPPLAVDGPVVSIRRFGARGFDLAELCDPVLAVRLELDVRARANIVVYGGTGSGKTTLLNSLAGCIPSGQRIVTVEDAAELRLASPNVVRLEARPANGEGAGRVTIRDLVRAALRLRPDRIVVGEVRGAEALDMVWAMSTGHDGSLSTVHANSASDAMARIETFALLADAALPLAAIRAQVVSAIDVLVGIRRLPDGRRRIEHVHRVDGTGALCAEPVDAAEGAP